MRRKDSRAYRDGGVFSVVTKSCFAAETLTTYRNTEISMDHGYGAAAACLAENEEKDLGRLFLQCAKAFNENAPSSLGTITSFGMIGMAKALKGQKEATLPQLARAMQKGWS